MVRSGTGISSSGLCFRSGPRGPHKGSELLVCVCESQREGPKAAPVTQYLRKTDRRVKVRPRGQTLLQNPAVSARPASNTPGCIPQVPNVLNRDSRCWDSLRSHQLSTG